MTRGWKEDFDFGVEALVLGSKSPGDPSVVNVARNIMTAYWVGAGDLRPLADAIAEGMPLKPWVGQVLWVLLNKNLVKVLDAEPKRGRPEQPELLKLVREARMSAAYEEYSRNEKSDEAFEKVAKDFGASVGTVRQAVTEMNKFTRERASL